MLLKFRPALTRVVLVVIALVVAGSQLVSSVRADASSGWVSQGSPTIQNVVQLPANQSPGIKNRDCEQQSYTLINSSTGAKASATDCFANSTLGQMALFGSPMLFAGTSLGIQINPNYPYVVQPIPNQGMMLALTSAPVTGSYMHFYQDIRQHLTSNTAGIGGPLVSYTINSVPDFSLRDRAGTLLPTNALGTLSYSSNGSWMLVDTPGGSFVRINMATFDVLPFAPSLNSPGDYSNRNGETAISDDGRYAAIATNDFGYFRVYDLTTCTGSTNNNYSQPLDCQSRDYWPAVSQQINGFKAIYSLRFINDDNISMTATYNWQSGTSYNAAKFTVTAPGKQAHSLDYLALGDSYISGEGEFQYKAGTDISTNFCHQSPLSYPFILGTDLYGQYNSTACSGAVTNDISNTQDKYRGQVRDNTQRQDRDADPIFIYFEPGKLAQWEFVKKYQPRVVTLSIGGNDIGFGQIVSKCVIATIRSDYCYKTYDERMKLVKTIDSTFSKLQDTYRLIQKIDPGVQVYIVGYPQVVKQGQCGVNVKLNGPAIDLAQNIVDYLDYTIEKAALSVGARYVDIRDAFVGHRLCEASSSNIAMNGFTAGTDRGAGGVKFIGAESYHPNVLGHQLIAQAILQKTNNMRQPMPAPDPSILPPKPTDADAQPLLGNYPNSGTIQPDIIQLANGAAANIIYRSVGTSFVVGSSFGLKPNTSYQVIVDEVGTLGSYRTDADGNLNISIALPSSTSVGYHTLSVLGKNMAEQIMEIDSMFYVAASQEDVDGNGVADTQQQCVIVPDAGIDLDSDGIDDACDAVIGDVPKQGYPAQVHLTGNTILITR